MSNPLEALGLNLDEVLAVDDSWRTRPSQRDGRVCICGHGVARHKVTEFGTTCNPSRMSCPCKRVRAVLDSEDTRPFLRKTQGFGTSHALVRGVAAVLALGKDVTWIDTPMCDVPECDTPYERVVPVPVTESGHPIDHASEFNAFLCNNHLMFLLGVEENDEQST